MKHVEVDYHFVRDQVTKKLLDVRFISTSDQVADGFMKPLPQGRLLEFQYNLNLIMTPFKHNVLGLYKLMPAVLRLTAKL
jgi:hypothetical protein